MASVLENRFEQRLEEERQVMMGERMDSRLSTEV